MGLEIFNGSSGDKLALNSIQNFECGSGFAPWSMALQLKPRYL
jgi:hypothetical protein